MISSFLPDSFVLVIKIPSFTDLVFKISNSISVHTGTNQCSDSDSKNLSDKKNRKYKGYHNASNIKTSLEFSIWILGECAEFLGEKILGDDWQSAADQEGHSAHEEQGSCGEIKNPAGQHQRKVLKEKCHNIQS